MALTNEQQESLLTDNRKIKSAIERNERRLEAILARLGAPQEKATKEEPKNG